jgi:alanine racemase
MYKIMLMNTTEGRVWAEVYLDRISHNYKLIKQKVERAEIMAAIKADAYGHGAVEVARILETEGISMFGVASLEEGIELREAGISSKILVLSPIVYSQIDALLEYNLIPTISELGFFKLLDEKLKARQKPMVVHVEVDTGMTRTGIPYREARDTIREIDHSPFITIEGIFSHFPLADADGSFTEKQLEEFGNLIKDLQRGNVNPHFVHIANSAGIFKYTRSHFNLVRPGIALYGLNSSPEVNFAKDFLPVMVLKSRVVNLRVVDAGTAVSYGHTFKTKRKSTIATVSVGYGDGYPRALSNCGEVLVNGRRALIIGMVCMDLIMIDVTDIEGVKVGDIVTLIGKDGTEMITAEECAIKSNTIVYEITSGIGPRVARVFKVRDRVISVRNLLGRWRNGG